LIRCEFINCSSWGIVVASTSIPETLVFVGLPGMAGVAAVTPDIPNKRASKVVRKRESRNRLLIA
jgi:hypothetical protein